MKYLKIQNNGELDIRLVALMGGTTKANDIFKIGQFGTGLKYTLSFLFRNNLDFKIFSGNNEVELYTETETIRDEDFEIVCINGNRTSITTRMGYDWSAWMIVRELWCNALDEGGALREVTESISSEEGKTTFYIQIDAQIKDVLDNWHVYFIHDAKPVCEGVEYNLYPAGDHLCIYKQGVLIKEMPEVKSVFSYDCKNANINELRELKDSAQYIITRALQTANAFAIKHFLETVTENHFEGSETFDYNWFNSWGKEWENVIGNGKIIHPKALESLAAKGVTLDTSNYIVVPHCLYKSLTKQFTGIGAVTLSNISHTFFEIYSEAVEDRIRQGLVILESCDYPMHNELKFVYGFFEDKTVNARIDIQEKTIYVSNALVQKPLFSIVSMLIEENEHFNTGLSDETRAFQQHFIDLYARTLLAKHAIEI